MKKIILISTIVFFALGGASPSTADQYKAWVCEDPKSNGNSANFKINKLVNSLLRRGEYAGCREVNEAYVSANTREVLFDLDKIRILEHPDRMKLMFDTYGK